ncbi:Sushi domain-containing protein 4 [Microtus ochrogaster]|uniref:Sushi domain-containing protein 4 n=1 Tax=Microtus ochrogaster TaxID=79684 RepID=A0A8J6GBZ3_MICOH|nr:Sushi domain-containing protein 4 [Microtus ochrogaster]
MVSHGDFICHPRPCERYNHGTVVEFYCDPGYSLTSDYKYITCQYGEWFPSYQVYCIKSEQTWPSTHETLLTTWKIVAFTATSVLLVLLLVILARMFQTKFKAHFPTRGPPRSSSSDPDFVVVDGVPVMLPTYDEASPPAYPGSGDTDTGAGESETCDSTSGSSELLQTLYSAPMCQGSSHPAPDTPDTIPSTAGEVASTSPGIDIADAQSHTINSIYSKELMCGEVVPPSQWTPWGTLPTVSNLPPRSQTLTLHSCLSFLLCLLTPWLPRAALERPPGKSLFPHEAGRERHKELSEAIPASFQKMLQQQDSKESVSFVGAQAGRKATATELQHHTMSSQVARTLPAITQCCAHQYFHHGHHLPFISPP